jgi:hypothetical protein
MMSVHFFIASVVDNLPCGAQIVAPLEGNGHSREGSGLSLRTFHHDDVWNLSHLFQHFATVLSATVPPEFLANSIHS